MENTQKVLDMDPNRLVTAASGFTDFEIGHIQDYHSYPYPTIGTWYPGVPTVDYPTTRRIRVVGEYGGIEYNVPGHTWYPNPSGVYDRPATSVEQLTMRFTNIAEWANAMAKQDGLSAAIYTEIADVENETNGLVTYDRKYDKINIGRIRPIIEYTIKSCSTADDFTTLVSPNAKWKYTLNTPSDGWQGMDFSDSSWKEDYGCFGDSGGKLFTSLRRTLWNTPDIWMRKVFNPGELTDEQIRHLFAELYVDGEVRVYINGVEALAFEEENWPLEKKHFYTLSDEAKKTICPNTDNVVAVHCHNAVGGCYIGLGLSVSNNIFGTGIGEVSGGKNQSLFEVYPNPVLDYVNIAFPAPLQNDEVVEFYSLTGIMTGRELIKAGTSHVSFSKSDFNLQSGTYIVKLKSASKILIVNG